MGARFVADCAVENSASAVAGHLCAVAAIVAIGADLVHAGETVAAAPAAED